MDKSELKRLMKGKTEEQKKAMKYFAATGCFSGAPSDEEFDAIVKAKANELGSKTRALGKIGMDEDQVNEIKPVQFYGFEDEIKGNNFYGSGTGKDGRFRTSIYSVTWLFFSDSQVFMYSVKFDTASDAKKETTEEYFYKDITNFSTTSETIPDTKSGAGKTKEISKFVLSVAGDKFGCSTMGVSDVESTIQGMKQKLREKKAQ